MGSKKKLRAKKRISNCITKPLICKIEIKEHGKSVMEFKGDLKNGFMKMKGICEDVFQVVDKTKGEEIDTAEK